MSRTWAAGIALVVFIQWLSIAAADEKLDSALDVVLAVSNEAKGNREASEAWKTLAAQEPPAIPALLEALDRSGPLAANYILSAIDAVVEQAQHAKQPLPADSLLEYLKDQSHNARARRVAFELLTRSDADLAETLIPTFLEDPSPELRRDAVAHWIQKADEAQKAGDQKMVKESLEKALSGAVDKDQVDLLASRLAPLGHTVNLADHFGLILDWKLIGPFDNSNEAGFAVAYPPESELDFAAAYDGKSAKVSWKDFRTDDPMGKVDLNKAVVESKSVIAYCASVVTLESPRKAQIRLGTQNGWKLWVNGESVFGQDEYHSGSNFDQFVFDVDLKSGENVILFKCCQNEQKEEWANDWSFQLRVCDATGTAILSTDRKATQARAN
jgi:hypothetical protein